MGWLLDKNWQGLYLEGSRHYEAGAYKNALMIVPFFIALAYIILLMIKEEKRTQ